MGDIERGLATAVTVLVLEAGKKKRARGFLDS